MKRKSLEIFAEGGVTILFVLPGLVTFFVLASIPQI